MAEKKNPPQPNTMTFNLGTGFQASYGQLSQARTQTNTVPPVPVLLSPPYNRSTPAQPAPSLTGYADSSASLSPKKRTTETTLEDDDQFKKHRAMDGMLSGASSPLPTPPKKGSGRGRKPAHELLSEDQKKANHIASEQKRRANIRIGFDQLVDIVPSLNDAQRSESMILHKSADYIRQLVGTKNTLRDRVRELQLQLGEVPDEDSSEGELDYM
ncbi:hypothetical protein DM01DRAFT_1386327 [Hesseltinella vesiculosa]|uniref:BHLH domain-containing protein n=1 Tax=Hesseltinella vesiculosa TaxID=101127 RepID=A0A1X2G638_9FUNG|nr:hypothetical protein DM01DRAFT_1386327 [Hesseltinella vesiculosa]